MSSVLHLIGPADVLPAIPWPLMCVIALAAITLVVVKSKARSKAPAVTYRNQRFLSKTEMRFFETLEKSVTPQYRVFAQVPLKTIVNAYSDDRSAQASARNRLDRKCVDFVLVDPYTFAIRQVVELYDGSHENPTREKRDRLVDDVLARAGIPIVHCKAQASYNPSVLRAHLGLPTA